MKLNELKDKVYENAVEHGWHDQDYDRKHWLCLVIAELMEAVEADRIGKYADRSQFENYMSMKERSDDEFIYAFKHGIKDTVEDELADACIRLLDFAGVEEDTLEEIDEHCVKKDYSNEPFTESIFDMVNAVTDYWQHFNISLIINRIFAFCRSRNIDIEWHICQKMRYNRHRPYKHGNKKY